MNSEIEQALNLAFKRLIAEISRTGELSKFENSLQQRKQYDQCERQYIENQRLRKELGNQYQSSDSEEEKENHFNKLSQIQLKKLMRKNLVDRNFDQDVLLPIRQNQQQQQQEGDDLMTTKLIAEESNSMHEINGVTQLNIIKQAKQIVQDQIEKETNFGLEFLINELQRINKIGLHQSLKLQHCK